MEYADFHVHSTFCDGKSTPEEIILRAIELQMYAIGISPHSIVPMEPKWPERHRIFESFKTEMNRLKSLYGDRIPIFTGVELDPYCDIDRSEFDYIISSLHYLKVGEEYLPTDWNGELIYSAADKYFGGDVYAYAQEYYRTVSTLADIGNVVIGHFDVITKFNEDGSMFDETLPVYMDAATAAVDALIKKDAVFEINTGAIFRGYRSRLYPSPILLKYMAQKGARVLLAGDAHRIEALCFRFQEAETIAREAGFKNIEKFPPAF